MLDNGIEEMAYIAAHPAVQHEYNKSSKTTKKRVVSSTTKESIKPNKLEGIEDMAHIAATHSSTPRKKKSSIISKVKDYIDSVHKDSDHSL